CVAEVMSPPVGALAQCTTVSTPSSAVFNPVPLRRSTAKASSSVGCGCLLTERTVCPLERRRSTTCLPRVPVPPVTRMVCMRYSFAGWKDHANNAVLAMGVVHAERRVLVGCLCSGLRFCEVRVGRSRSLWGAGDVRGGCCRASRNEFVGSGVRGVRARRFLRGSHHGRLTRRPDGRRRPCCRRRVSPDQVVEGPTAVAKTGRFCPEQGVALRPRTS